MIPLIQLATQYSNAVLVAILPQVSDFAIKSELPIPTPVVSEHIRQFRPLMIGDEIGGVFVFTNGIRLRYLRGMVEGFDTPRSYFNVQNPRDIPKFYGELGMSKDEALQFARDHIHRLGYSLKETFTDQDPQKVDMPQHIGTNTVPFYQFHWQDPVFHATAIRVEVDANKRQIQSLALMSPFLWRAAPQLKVTNSAKSAASFSLDYTNQYLKNVLPKISNFGNKLGLPIKPQITFKQVEKVAFLISNEYVAIKLKSGLWFSIQNGEVTEFNTLDSVYGRRDVMLEPFVRPLKKYLGKWRMSSDQAVEMARQNLSNLGLNLHDWGVDTMPQIIRHEQVGRYVVPRYFLRWLTNNQATGNRDAYVRVEIDADKKHVKYVEFLRGDANPHISRVKTETPDFSNPFQNTQRPTANRASVPTMQFLTNAPKIYLELNTQNQMTNNSEGFGPNRFE